MPTYVYRCKKCKHRFELFHSISDETVKRCPRCRSKAERVPAAGAGILFKGSGFYITDYRSKSYQERAKQEKSGSSKSSDSGSSGSSTDKGPATPKEPKPSPKPAKKPGGSGSKSGGGD